MSKWDTRDIGNGLSATVVPPDSGLDGKNSHRWFIHRDEGSVRTVLTEKYADSAKAAWAAIGKAKNKFK